MLSFHVLHLTYVYLWVLVLNFAVLHHFLLLDFLAVIFQGTLYRPLGISAIEGPTGAREGLALYYPKLFPVIKAEEQTFYFILHTQKRLINVKLKTKK